MLNGAENTSPNHALLSPLQGNVQTCLQELTSRLQAGSSARGRYDGNRKLLDLRYEIIV